MPLKPGTRLVTNENGVAKARFDYFPFGQPIMASGSTGRGGVLCGSVSCYPQDVVTPPAVSQQFTGMQHDLETGMDYFYARYYSGAEGRFTGADLPLIDQYPFDPQSWNLYGYVRNNPLIYIDPDGHACGAVSTAIRAATVMERPPRFAIVTLSA